MENSEICLVSNTVSKKKMKEVIKLNYIYDLQAIVVQTMIVYRKGIWEESHAEPSLKIMFRYLTSVTD